MCNNDYIAAKGNWGTVRWAIIPPNSSSQAREFYLALDKDNKAKVLTLFQRLAEFGTIQNREKFRKLGEKAGSQARGLCEFKSHQIRFIGDFRPDHRFIVAWGTRKKKDELDRSDIDAALKILIDYDAANPKKVR